eukprot:TRINITY_DN5389_c0_g1_i6.p1 TRINITY_DN5389_c0_g1~~TRINITY_DN5389_c0_g1_i6.p1  ORF type:complete len:436 (-),score=20.28 TRINITY_DN5389_c0_g1_i6:407-1714(-)
MDDEEYKDSVTRCVCNRNDIVDIFMVSCDGCSVWQHGECVGINEDRVPDKYFCDMCSANRRTDAGRKPKGKNVTIGDSSPSASPRSPRFADADSTVRRRGAKKVDVANGKGAKRRGPRASSKTIPSSNESEGKRPKRRQASKADEENQSDEENAKSPTASSAKLSREDRKLRRIMQQFEALESNTNGKPNRKRKADPLASNPAETSKRPSRKSTPKSGEKNVKTSNSSKTPKTSAKIRGSGKRRIPTDSDQRPAKTQRTTRKQNANSGTPHEEKTHPSAALSTKSEPNPRPCPPYSLLTTSSQPVSFPSVGSTHLRPTHQAVSLPIPRLCYFRLSDGTRITTPNVPEHLDRKSWLLGKSNRPVQAPSHLGLPLAKRIYLQYLAERPTDSQTGRTSRKDDALSSKKDHLPQSSKKETRPSAIRNKKSVSSSRTAQV